MNTKIITTIRFLLGLFFIFSGTAKFWSLQSFIGVLQGYSYLSQTTTTLLGYGIPIIEIMLGSLLLVAYYVREVSLLLLILIFMFTVVAYTNYEQGQIGDCGCFGGLIERQNDWRLHVENMIIIILLAIVFIRENSYTK